MYFLSLLMSKNGVAGVSECCIKIRCLHGVVQGQLQEWTEHSTLIFENLKPLEISKKKF